ncbi:MAG TPA: hypothetical protein VLH79_09275 [Chthonomonadales bacterium]|nr:hypothetical protein [Chthonomonadales bacterium]
MMDQGVALAVLLGVAGLYAWHHAKRLRGPRREESAPRNKASGGRGEVTYLRDRGGSARERARQEAIARVMERVGRMSLEEARCAAEPLLREPRVWRPSGGPPSGAELARLAPGLRALVAQAAAVDVLGGALRIDGARAAEWRMPHADVLSFGAGTREAEAFVRIGTDDAGSPMVARPGEEDVFVVRGSDSGRAAWTVRYASLYHWLLVHHGLEEETRRVSGR